MEDVGFARLLRNMWQETILLADPTYLARLGSGPGLNDQTRLNDQFAKAYF